jgi:ethanolamine ammonia-lyase large subunit
MATRQRARSQRKSSAAPVISGEQIAGTAASESNERVDDSQVLRSAFDTTPFEEGETASTESAEVPQVNFVGEQLVYKDRYERIAEAAYLRAEQRGFEPGHEVEDWLAAEREIDALLSRDENRDRQ